MQQAEFLQDIGDSEKKVENEVIISTSEIEKILGTREKLSVVLHYLLTYLTSVRS